MVTIGVYDVDFVIQSTTKEGLKPFTKSTSPFFDLGIRAAAWAIEPKRFKLLADVRITPNSDILPNIEIGFIQSVQSSKNFANYGAANSTLYYKTSLSDYPTRDGSIAPWFKTDEDGKISVDSTAQFPVEFIINVSDRPRFFFPLELDGLEISNAYSMKEFIIWLVAKYEDRFYFLYSVRWIFIGAFSSGGMPPSNIKSGVFILEQGPVLNPSSQPREAKLDGPAANSASTYVKKQGHQPWPS